MLDKFVLVLPRRHPHLQPHARRSTSQHLREVLTRLREQKLYAKLQQVRVHAARGGVPRPPHRRRRAVASRRTRSAPCATGRRRKNVSDVRSFLGLASFYRRFVQGLQPHRAAADRADQETTCRWQWGAAQQQAFDALKAALCSRARAADPRPAQAVHAQLRRVQLRHRRHAAAGPRQRPAAGRLPLAQDDARRAQLRRAREGVPGAGRRVPALAPLPAQRRSRSRC